MISKAIRFYSVSRDAADDLDLGSAWITDDGELDYSNDTIRRLMQPMVIRVGPEKAFRFYTPWSNGYVRSEPIALAGKTG